MNVYINIICFIVITIYTNYVLYVLLGGNDPPSRPYQRRIIPLYYSSVIGILEWNLTIASIVSR